MSVLDSSCARSNTGKQRDILHERIDGPLWWFEYVHCDFWARFFQSMKNLPRDLGVEVAALCVQNTRHHLSSCFPSIEKVQLIKAELKEHLTSNDLRTAIPKSSLWPHLKYPNNVLAFAFFSELLEHPKLLLWEGNYDTYFAIATGARYGCLACKAAMVHELEFFDNYEMDEKKRVSNTRKAWIEDINTELKKADEQPFLCLLTAALLQKSTELPWIDDAIVSKWVQQAIDTQDYRIFRFGRDFPDVFKMTIKGEYGDSSDWLCWQAYLHEDQQKFVRASDMGSIEATMHLARSRDLSHDERIQRYKKASAKYPPIALEMANYQLRLDALERAGSPRNQQPSGKRRQEATEALQDLGRRGEKRAYERLSNIEKDKAVRKQYKEEAGEYCTEELDDKFIIDRMLGDV